MKGTSLIKDNVMLNFGFPYSIIFTDFKTSVCACVCVCMCVCPCMCVCMYVSVCRSASAFFGLCFWRRKYFLGRSSRMGWEEKKRAKDWESGDEFQGGLCT